VTSGGNALKFYASVRLEVRRKMTHESAKGESTGIRVKAKVGKNCPEQHLLRALHFVGHVQSTGPRWEAKVGGNWPSTSLLPASTSQAVSAKALPCKAARREKGPAVQGGIMLLLRCAGALEGKAHGDRWLLHALTAAAATACLLHALTAAGGLHGSCMR
jgi:hypothetical protein